MKAVVALGANLGEPRKQVAFAIELIKDLMDVVATSSFYETEPVGVPDEQPNYINAIVIGQSDLKPVDLMKALLTVETKLGRERSFQNAARTIDIDLIDYGGYFIESELLTLPHPRAHERRFVLEPWLEIDPTGVLAGKGAISELLAGLN
jgi:2-amino-4-hydroxy-6-hydroxymethyldihydropteridine diphosphokinase